MLGESVLTLSRCLSIQVRPSRGVLLYGAPGCGKTTLVRAVAGLAGVAFLHASGTLGRCLPN